MIRITDNIDNHTVVNFKEFKEKQKGYYKRGIGFKIPFTNKYFLFYF